ncbi:hypothetical protein Tco_0620020 [Tanacetum coccineum]
MDAIIARTWNLDDRSLTPAKIYPLSDIVPSTVDTKYFVELADGKVIGIDTIIKDYELNFLNHLFKIDLIPIEPGDETLTIRSNRSDGYASIVASKQSCLIGLIHKARVEALKKENVKDKNLHGMDKEFENCLDGTLCIRSRSGLLGVTNLGEFIKHELHKPNYFIHRGIG